MAVFFIPAGNVSAAETIKALAAEVTDKRGITRIGWREVPVNADALGKIALASRPQVEHLLMKRPAGMDGDTFERQLYLCRREIERRTEEIQGFYMPSFSSRLIFYKALAMPAALRAFYLDFSDPDYEVAIALYHQRFSTNTFPARPKNFHTYVKSGKSEDYEEYVRVALETNPIAIKDLIDFVPSSAGSIPLEEVEPMDSIRRRFTTAAMSLGALSPEAHETLAIAVNRIVGKSDSGEGGEDPMRYKPYPNGDFARS